MIPTQWTPPCNSQCTHKYAALMQIPWRVFCKKGCDADGETWDDCLGECDEICYKDPVLKDQQWSAYIDRSPGSASYSEGVVGYKSLHYLVDDSLECFRACVSGCGYKFEVPSEKVSQVHSRPPKPPIEEKPAIDPPAAESRPTNVVNPDPDEVPSISA